VRPRARYGIAQTLPTARRIVDISAAVARAPARPALQSMFCNRSSEKASMHKYSKTLGRAAAVALSAASLAFAAHAQVTTTPATTPPAAAPLTRMQATMDRDEFLRTNKWDPLRSGWRPMGGTPRDLNALSRAQVKSDTVNFMRTHRFDEPTQTWVEKLSAPVPKS
jgi:hypothetical protein